MEFQSTREKKASVNYILSAEEMRSFDRGTIENHHIPSLVLMERAALAVCEKIEALLAPGSEIGIFAGPGNNGGDGVAVARLLQLAGYNVSVLLLGKTAKYSDSLNAEIDIARSYDVKLVSAEEIGLSQALTHFSDCVLLVDAIFGIGLCREISGDFASAVSYINASPAAVLAVDIPSGFDTDTGNRLGCGVSADYTVTFGYMKKGLVLSDCALACGEVNVADVGIYADFGDTAFSSLLLDDAILSSLPVRAKNANKGTQGKLLIIAGSESIYGACYLSALAALTCGSGLVRIYTHEANISSIQQSLPETMYTAYRDYDPSLLTSALQWADTVLIGPGLSTSPLAAHIFADVCRQVDVPTVVDADGLNLLARQPEALLQLEAKKIPVILTPHLKEMERLTGVKTADINSNMEKTALSYVAEHAVTLVLKNFTTIIAGSHKHDYFCTSGNEGLATPGSGDVLAGIIASLLGQGLSAENAACLGAYLHGLSGTRAAEKKSTQGVLARDIIAELPTFL